MHGAWLRLETTRHFSMWTRGARDLAANPVISDLSCSCPVVLVPSLFKTPKTLDYTL